MLNHTNIFLIVKQNISENKVILWDDSTSKIINEFEYISNIKKIKIKNDKIIVLLSNRIYLYDLQTMKNIYSYETFDNPKGLFDYYNSPKINILIYPSEFIGFFKIQYFDKELLINTNKPTDSPDDISYLTLSQNGLLIAASTLIGTLLKIYYSLDGELIEEFQIDKEPSVINNICFDFNTNFIAASTNKKIIHIWSLGNTWNIIKNKKGLNINKNLPNNNVSFLKILPDFLTGGDYNLDQSFAQIKINNEKIFCEFGNNNFIYLIDYKGNFNICLFDEIKGGNCKIKENYLITEHN